MNMCIFCGYGGLKGNRHCADVIYQRKDNLGASTFISAAVESKLRI